MIKGASKLFIKILCLIILLTTVGCAALSEGYSTHYGLTSTDYPSVGPNVAEETYKGGTVGIQEIEEYDEKYREKDVIERAVAPEPSEQ